MKILRIEMTQNRYWCILIGGFTTCGMRQKESGIYNERTYHREDERNIGIYFFLSGDIRTGKKVVRALARFWTGKVFPSPGGLRDLTQLFWPSGGEGEPVIGFLAEV